ncbi:MAG: polysaccharide deacetylase family protein [Tannerella sp.]|jgi:hypothetical protein|nr:polysaccharide deacetylase family protein [Tannerella sp.]
MLLIYTPHITGRIAFIIDVIFKGHLQIPYRLTDSIDKFRQAERKISYAPHPISVEDENEIFIWQHPLLMETDIKEQIIDQGYFEAEPVFFQTSHGRSFLPFDIFALSFYLLTRYEEYLPHREDKYGRFPATESIACKTGFLQKPLVDILVIKFVRKLQTVFPELQIELPPPGYIATYDIDHAFAYRHKGWIRTAGGLVRQLLRLNLKEINKRIAVLTGKKQDPYDTYSYIESIRHKYKLDSYFFILIAELSPYDRGISPGNRSFHKLIRQLHRNGKIGCHPSFASSFSSEKLMHEINHLAGIIQENIRYSRSHYLLLNFPQTYQQFIAAGMEMDFTMGYPELPGFRASTCKIFPFFDLSANETTSLQLLPFAYMEETFQKYMNLKPDEAYEWIKKLIFNVKSVHGTFVSLWHNENFDQNGGDWKRIYEKSLELFFANQEDKD